MDTANKIDYDKLFKALAFYKSKGYTYKDVSWTVRPEVSSITRPVNCVDFYVKDMVLVSSAEQSFLQMMTDDKLPKGRYCAITPCFRDELVDELHAQYFMKVELINTAKVDLDTVEQMITIAHAFFSHYLDVKIEKTSDSSYDIVSSKTGIELGSYGLRSHKEMAWVYGTGCAEPRLSYAIGLKS